MTVRSRRDLSNLADEDLLARLVRRDVDALATLYDRHAGALFAYASRLHEDRGAADKVLHDAFLSLWRSPSSYSPARGTVRKWLLTVVGSAAIGVPPGATPID